MSRTIPAWPILTLVGIALAVLCGYAHSAGIALRSYLACEDELGQRTDNVDPFGGDW